VAAAHGQQAVRKGVLKLRAVVVAGRDGRSMLGKGMAGHLLPRKEFGASDSRANSTARRVRVQRRSGGQKVESELRQRGRSTAPPNTARLLNIHGGNEGFCTPTGRNVLIEPGRPLRLHAGRLKRAPDGSDATGNGRRESFSRYPPMPRI